MKLRFLCAAHREQLASHPTQAIHSWQNGFDTGKTLYDEGLWQDALPHVGCAFETADILMTTHAIPPHDAYRLFTSSAVMLANTFARLGDIAQCQQIYWLAINRLERELPANSDAVVFINRHLSDLYRYVQQLGHPVMKPVSFERSIQSNTSIH